MIFLVRHGQTDWNKQRIFNGITETELNETGIQQSEVAREELRCRNIEICFTSPQKRAVQASKIIYDGEFIFDDRLTEIVCGDFEGIEETNEAFEAFWVASKIGEKGVEKFSHFLERNCEFCEMITKNYKDKNILILTHAANARVINYFFTGKDKDYDFSKAVSCSGGITELSN